MLTHCLTQIAWNISILHDLAGPGRIVIPGLCADPIRGLPASWSTKIRTGGLATILMRAGLKIDKNAFKRAGRVVLSLALVPVICEAIVDGFCFYWCVWAAEICCWGRPWCLAGLVLQLRLCEGWLGCCYCWHGGDIAFRPAGHLAPVWSSHCVPG